MLAATSVSAADFGGQPDWTGHVSYVAGYQRMASKWSPAENQVEFGLIDANFAPRSWPVSLCVQTLLSYQDRIPNIPGATGDYSGAWEFNFGVRKIWEPSRSWHPFVGGGLSVAGASVCSWVRWPFGGSQVTEDSDTGVGAWGGGGVYWNLSDHWHLGVEAQYSWAEIKLFGNNMQAGGWHALFMCGVHW